MNFADAVKNSPHEIVFRRFNGRPCYVDLERTHPLINFLKESLTPASMPDFVAALDGDGIFKTTTSGYYRTIKLEFKTCDSYGGMNAAEVIDAFDDWEPVMELPHAT